MMKSIAAIAACVVLGAAPAWADGLQLSGAVAVTGNGFGANPRALTIQSHGPQQNVESGCIAPTAGGGLMAGSGACAGFGVVGGNESSPIGFPKQSAPSMSSLGITSGSQIGILFDAVQPQNGRDSSLNINDLTLKLYNGDNLIWTATGSWNNLNTTAGNGRSDFLFVLDPSAVKSFDTACAGNYSDQLALDSTISFARQSAGPDSYSFENLGASVTTPAPTPEPSSLALMGTGMFAVAFWMYSNKRKHAVDGAL